MPGHELDKTALSINSLHTARRFTGVDVHTEPGNLGEGSLTQADNLLLTGGVATTRPGLAGQLDTPLGAALYAPVPYLKPGGATEIVFTCDGKLYRLPKGDAAASEIKKPGDVSFSLDSPNTFMVRAGKYIYPVDGVSPLQRTDLTTGAVVTSLLNPIAAPVAQLTNQTLGTLADHTFSTGTGSTAELLPSTDLSNGAYWTGGGETSDYGNGGWWMDQSGDSRTLAAAVLNPADIGDPTLHGKQFQVSFQVQHTNGSDSPWDPGKLTFTAYSDTAGTAVLATSDFTFPGDISTVLHVFDFSHLTTEILSINLKWETTLDHQFHGYTAVYPSVKAFANGLQLVKSDETVIVGPGTFYFNGMGIACAGSAITFDLGAGTDWSSVSRVALPLQYNPSSVGGLRLGLRFQQDGSMDTWDSNPMTISADGRFASVDVTAAIPDDVLASFRYLSVVILDNVTFSVVPATLFTLSTVISAGNLSIGYADYHYLFTEEDENGDPALLNIIESGESAMSNGLTPTNTKAEALVTLPVKQNSSAQRFTLYRRGGVYSDGLGRKIASWRFDGAAGNEDSNPYVAFDPTTRVLTDNTPDSYLLLADTLVTGRAPAPVGAQAVCSWQGRLWLAKGSTLYASWLMDANQQDALYFSQINLLNDPQGAIKGATFSLGGADNDPIQQIVAYGSNAYFRDGFLVVFKQNSIWLVSGLDPTTWTAQSYLLGSGVGCSAPRAAGVVLNHIWFVGPDGLYQFNADVVTPRSLQIEKLLHPADSAISAAAYRLCATTTHDRRLWVFAPQPGDTENTCAHVWDSRNAAGDGGYTRQLGLRITSAATLASGSDSSELWMAGADGQMYTLSGTADIGAPGSNAVPIAWTLRSRGMGQESNDLAYYRTTVAVRLHYQVRLVASATVTATIAGDDPALAWSADYTANGILSPRLRVSSAVRGSLLYVTLSGAGPAQIDSLTLVTVERGF